MAQMAVSTLAGSGSVGSGNGTGSAASFNFTNPSGAVIVGSNVYITDPLNHTIRVSDANGAVTTHAGAATVSGSTDNADRTLARFNSPQGIAADTAGNLYIADSGNHTIRRITTAGAVSTLAGTALSSGQTNGTGAAARFNSPLGIAVDGAGANVYVADTQNHVIRRVVVSSGEVTTLAGTMGVSGNTATTFNHPDALAISADGTTLYVADTFNHTIRQVTIATPGTITTLAGSGAQGQADGTGTGATFDNPAGITVNGTNLLVADTFNHTIRNVTTGGVVTTIAGLADNSGSANGLSTAARFNYPSGITTNGTVTYVVDTNNLLVRRIRAATAPSITTQPTAQSVAANGTASFTAAASGDPAPTYQWQIQVGGTGSFSNLSNTTTYSGVTTGTLQVSNATIGMSGDRFQLVATNGVGSPATSAAATLTVTQMPAFTSATTANFVAGQTTNFQVSASGSPAPSISVVGSLPSWLGFNTDTKVLTGSPTSSNTNASVTFRATNTAGSVDQTFNAVVVTTVAPQLSTVANQQVGQGGTTAGFSVTATGTPSDFTYQWERRPASGGTFTALSNSVVDGATYSGVTTATLGISGVSPNMNGDSYRVVVTSGGGTTTSNIANLAVTPVITSPSVVTFVTNQFNSYSASATGNPAPTISINPTSAPNGLTVSGTSISGTPTDTFTTVYYTITATNSGGTATQSLQLNISVPQSPTITSSSSTTFSVGQQGTFTFQATGSPSPTIQVFGALPQGVIYNQSTATLIGTPENATGSPFMLTVQASNASGTVQQTFTLTVLGVAPTIVTHPTNTTVNLGQTATFTASAQGTPTPTLRWQRQPSGTSGFIDLSDDGVYSGTTSNTLTITNASAAMSLDQYRLRATNGTPPDATSIGAQLVVNIGTVISTYAGSAGASGASNGAGNIARFNSPSGMAMDFSGNLYVADTANHTIRKIAPGGVVTTLAGLPGFNGFANGSGTDARFNSPQGVAVDGVGNVYVADTFNHVIRVISPGGSVTTLAGSPGASGAIDAADPTQVRFFSPTALAVDTSGQVYVADTSNHAIRKVLSNGSTSTFAGLMGSAGHSDSAGTSARFNSPSGIAVDTFGNIYVSDSQNQVIRRITTGGSVSTLAGVPGAGGTSDGAGIAARFNRPTGMAVDTQGNIYVADTVASTIRKITSGGDVTTIAGLAFNTGSTDGAGTSARFNQPQGIAVDTQGNVFISDTRNHTIRRSGLATAPQIQTQPVNRVAAVGGSITFTAVATGAPTPGYQWQRAPVGSFDTFTNLSNDGTYSGVNTGTLTVTNVTQQMSGDQFRVVANNGVPSPATSNSAVLTVGTAPSITSPSNAQFQAGQAGVFRITANSDTPVTFSATGLPSWATLNAVSGEISGTPPNTDGSPFTVTITAANPVQATSTLTIAVSPAIISPSITTQPANASVQQGQTATFSVAASGTDPLTYQWTRNGINIPGATSASLILPNVQISSEGSYAVTVRNSAGSVTSNPASLVVNAFPAFTSQPRSQVATAGSSVTFSVSASGGGSFSYQWRRNGVPLPGANGSTYTVNSVSANDVGNYDVIVSNTLGSITSSLAQLTLVNGATSPVITAQPASRTVVVGSRVNLTVGATAVPAPAYQWRKNGVPISGATNAVYSIAGAQVGDAGVYDVTVNNGQGVATSAQSVLTVLTRSYAGVYFGAFTNGLGQFSIVVRDDHTGVFLGYLPGMNAPVLGLAITVGEGGQFSFSQGQIVAAAAGNPDEPARAAALSPVIVIGNIQNDGTVQGLLSGGANASLSGTRSSDTGITQGVVGYYQAGARTNAAVVHTIAGPDGQAFVVGQSGATTDGGLGAVAANGQVNVVTSRSNFTLNITPGAGTVAGTATGAVSASVSGGIDWLAARQRLLNISSRARVTSGDAVAIAGFVIAGEESKPVLIRAVGPTLSGAPFNVPGALTTPRLELRRGGSDTVIQSNSGIGTNRVALDAAGAQAGAFQLGTSGNDAAILTTLAPGAYTAVVSSTSNATGVALVEVYDLSSPTPGQKLLNISTRATAGTNENTLIAGFVVPGGAPKRVLIRGIGPGLQPFGVTGFLQQPTLTVMTGSTVVAQNTTWSTSTDQVPITAASGQVGAFGMAPQDAALILTLSPGDYTAQVSGANNATGIALIEVYELP